ncbi:hypothetical protein COLO4_07459 [Corchorus olitorius]|uniref:RNase H type-1 domain-containing protein n=1 Tax=Corchorus olitorius TaxID=93759 RepID=A0A1R3KJL8_9ROSI|nr:hypothetical protein COLO4_07459 [Corchorus olitorius]
MSVRIEPGSDTQDGSNSRIPKKWYLWIETTKKEGRAGYGAAAIAKGDTGDIVMATRNLYTESALGARLEILRIILNRIAPFGNYKIWCRDTTKKWEKIWNNRTRVPWKLKPVMEDIQDQKEKGNHMVFYNFGHPLVKEVKKAAQAATSTNISFSWP